jgi:hypothetical protein
MTNITKIDITDYVECLLMHHKRISLKDGIIFGDGFEVDLNIEVDKELEFVDLTADADRNGVYESHVILARGNYVVALVNENNKKLVVFGGVVHK